jgi:hypothetical protein
MTQQATPMAKVIQTHILSDVQYKALEAKLVRSDVDNNTSPIAAGYKLGVQAVLKALRDGFVSGA